MQKPLLSDILQQSISFVTYLLMEGILCLVFSSLDNGTSAPRSGSKAASTFTEGSIQKDADSTRAGPGEADIVPE